MSNNRIPLFNLFGNFDYLTSELNRHRDRHPFLFESFEAVAPEIFKKATGGVADTTKGCDNDGCACAKSNVGDSDASRAEKNNSQRDTSSFSESVSAKNQSSSNVNGDIAFHSSSFNKENMLYEIRVLAPDVDKEDLDIDIDEGYLNVSFKYNEQSDPYSLNKHFSEFYKNIKLTLPEEINEDSVKASLEKGVLLITFDVKEKESTKKTVEIS